MSNISPDPNTRKLYISRGQVLIRRTTLQASHTRLVEVLPYTCTARCICRVLISSFTYVSGTFGAHSGHTRHELNPDMAPRLF